MGGLRLVAEFSKYAWSSEEPFSCISYMARVRALYQFLRIRIDSVPGTIGSECMQEFSAKDRALNIYITDINEGFRNNKNFASSPRTAGW